MCVFEDFEKTKRQNVVIKAMSSPACTLRWTCNAIRVLDCVQESLQSIHIMAGHPQCARHEQLLGVHRMKEMLPMLAACSILHRRLCNVVAFLLQVDVRTESIWMALTMPTASTIMQGESSDLWVHPIRITIRTTDEGKR